MSVAFRRDGDEEHLEPKFERPLPPGPNYVTARGLALIESEVAALERALPAITEEATLAAAKRDLRYWRQRLATAEVRDAPSGQTVEFGCRVEFLLNGQPRTVELVGHDEADAGAGRIAFTAPLGRALLGAEVGDLADFNGRTDAIEIVAIRAA